METECMTEQNVKMHIDIKSDNLNLAFSNNGSRMVRVWEFSNSWGWDVLSLMIRSQGLDRQCILTRRKTMGWTKNGPTFKAIEPDSHIEIQIYPDSHWWEFDQDLSVLEDRPLVVKAVLDIPDSPEARELGVFVGRVESEWVQSKPPHRWLFQRD
jgi:hypothetical protein